jgi:GDPmannose 4,6-dehydratase
MPRALITGIAGQDGSYLAEQLLSEGYEVVGLDRFPQAADASNLVSIADQFDYVRGDLRDPKSLAEAVSNSGASEVYHFASPTFVPESWDNPVATVEAIVGSTARLLTAALSTRSRPRIWLSASSEVFGDTDVCPQNEFSSMRPRSPYGVAKLAALGLVRTLRHHHGLFACSGILYNHESPRRPQHFLSRKVTRGAAAIALGQQDELVLGDLDAVRDWSDARDIVRGAALAMRADEPRDYVFASGRGRTVRELVQVAFTAAGIGDRVANSIRVNPDLVRRSEAIQSVGDSSLAERELGWRSAISFEEMIGAMVAVDLVELGKAEFSSE